MPAPADERRSATIWPKVIGPNGITLGVRSIILNSSPDEFKIIDLTPRAFHGVARATTDLDILVDPGEFERALQAVRELGFDVEALPMTFADGMEVRRVTKIDGSDSLTLDFLLARGPLQAVLQERVSVETLEGPVSVVSLEGLVRMKAWAGRPQDLADIARLRDLDR